jgi:hypothetical protein
MNSQINGMIIIRACTCVLSCLQNAYAQAQQQASLDTSMYNYLQADPEFLGLMARSVFFLVSLVIIQKKNYCVKTQIITKTIRLTTLIKVECPNLCP